MNSYSKTAMERAMKVQEVILRALAKKITWWQAAEIIGINDQQMRRWRERYEEFGYDGLFDRRRGKPSPKRVPVAMVEQVLGLYREKYFDFNVRHFQEKAAGRAWPEIKLHLRETGAAGSGLVERGANRECIANGDRDGPCRACCCTSMAVIIVGSRMNAGTT
jgi:transposase-like protein